MMQDIYYSDTFLVYLKIGVIQAGSHSQKVSINQVFDTK